MKKNIPSILLVGVGRWGENHLRVLLRLQANGLCRLAGVYDIDQPRLRYIGKEFDVQTFDNNEQGLEKADAVVIAVPTYDHFVVAAKALSAGKDVLVEKPMTKTLEEALELEKIHSGSSQIFMVGHLFRYNPALDFVKKLLQDREIGNILFLRGRFMGFRFKERDAGILATTAIHFIYLSSYLLDKTPKTVWAKTNYLLDTRYLLDARLDDSCLVRLDYDPEFSLIESDYFTPGKWRTFDIIGTQGAILFDALSQKVELHQKKHMYIGGRFEAYDGSTMCPDIEFQEPLYLELSHFLECVRTRKEPLTGVKDGVDVLRIIEAAYKSSDLGQPVTLETLQTSKKEVVA